MVDEEKLQQNANEFVSALINTLGKETVQEVVEKNFDDAMDVAHISGTFQPDKIPPDVAARLKDLAMVVKDTSMDTRHDLNLAFPPSHFSNTDNPLMLFYKSYYDIIAHYTMLIENNLNVRDALIQAMADHGYTEENIDEFLKREWDIHAHLMSLPQIAETYKEVPDYSDYNHEKPNNYSLQNAQRKIEHMMGGRLVEKISTENLPLEETKDVSEEVINRLFLEECLAALSPEDRELLIRYADGESLTSLAKNYGYASASGVRKRIERIKKSIIM